MTKILGLLPFIVRCAILQSLTQVHLQLNLMLLSFPCPAPGTGGLDKCSTNDGRRGEMMKEQQQGRKILMIRTMTARMTAATN